MTKLKLLLIVGVLALLIMAIVPAQAQGEIVITLSASEFSEDVYRQVADAFEAQNPGVRVYLDSYNGFGSPINAGGDVEGYLDDFEELVSSADVVAIGNSLLPEATRAGYLLDLAPLANSDASLNTADFFPAMWNSFQWDGGIWGIPVSGQAITIYFDPVAFDEAGVPYPDENWTITDFDSAVRTLAQYDNSGNVTVPGFLNLGGDLGTLFASLLGQGVYDNSVFPSVPNYDNASLESLLTIWANLEADGLVNFPTTEAFIFNDAPMVLGGSFLAGGGGGFIVAGGGDDDEPAVSVERIPTLLPGGAVGLDVTGYGVSSGSQNPEIAYELVKFLSNSPEIIATFFGDTPARRSLIGVEADNGQGGGGIILESLTSEEIEAFLQSALETALPVSEVRFLTQISDAITSINDDGLDVVTALDELEVAVLDRLQFADERGAITEISITPPPEATVLNAGEISLNFGLNGFVLDEDQWQDVADEFVANDPEIGAIIMDTVQGFGGNDLATLTETYDCFYQNTNIVPNADLSLLRNIDPLISTDFNFNVDDIVTGALELLQVNGQTWGYPLTIEPLVMRANPDLFAQAGAVIPNGTWSVAQFEDALRALDSFMGEDEFAFNPQAFDNAYILNLIASYGGLPVDSRTSPTTYNFTDPANVEAIRQVLDLAVSGFMEYNELASNPGLISISFSEDGEGEDVALYTEMMSVLGVRGGGGGFVIASGGDFEAPENTDVLTTFPTGSQFNVVSYDLGTAYISATSPYPEACYRFISAIAQNPDLFPSMPASRTLINDPRLADIQGQSAVDFYNALDALLGQSTTIVLPTFGGGGGSNLDTFWLNRVFDQYVAGEILDLEEALAEAEVFTLAYQECTVDIPEFDPASGRNIQQYLSQFTDCAIQIDPSSESFFPNFG